MNALAVATFIASPAALELGFTAEDLTNSARLEIAANWASVNL